MTKAYGIYQAQSAAYTALQERFGWHNAPRMRQWEWPHALIALDTCHEQGPTLSIGANWCELTVALVGRVPELVAVDKAPSFKVWAKKRLRSPGDEGDYGTVQALVHDGCSLPFPDGHFDRIVSVSTLEHVHPRADGDTQMMNEIARLLHPSGRAVVTIEASRAYVEWQLPVGRSYNADAAYRRLLHPSGLQFVTEDVDDSLHDVWANADWQYAQQEPWEMLPVCLVLEHPQE